MAVNKTDVQQVRYRFSRARVKLLRRVMHLWHYQQLIVPYSAERNPSEWDTGKMCEYWHSIVINGFAISCKEHKNVCTLVTNLEYTRNEINPPKILSWAHKWFATRVHTLFYIGPDKKGDILQTTLLMYFAEWKSLYFEPNFTVGCSKWIQMTISNHWFG